LRAVIARAAIPANQVVAVDRKGGMTIDLTQPFHIIERQIIEEAIRRSGDSILKASQMLEISPSTIYRKKDGWEAA
jgi:DNA-binding NtrC family response regulator